MPSIQELARSSGFIFSGTVVERGKSTVPSAVPNEKFVVVRFDRGLRVDPVLGDLRGKLITVVAAAPEGLSPGQKAVFFANSWIHGGGIAVRELGHVDISESDNVAAAIAQLPQAHLLERLQKAVLVVVAEVTRVGSVEKRSFERNAALWSAAELKVDSVLFGTPLKSTVVYFPTSGHPVWAHAPRFKEGQRGIFVLHAPNRKATPSEATLGPDGLVALDPGDFQAESERSEVEKLLGAIK